MAVATPGGKKTKERRRHFSRNSHSSVAVVIVSLPPENLVMNIKDHISHVQPAFWCGP